MGGVQETPMDISVLDTEIYRERNQEIKVKIKWRSCRVSKVTAGWLLGLEVMGLA